MSAVKSLRLVAILAVPVLLGAGVWWWQGHGSVEPQATKPHKEQGTHHATGDKKTDQGKGNATRDTAAASPVAGPAMKPVMEPPRSSRTAAATPSTVVRFADNAARQAFLTRNNLRQSDIQPVPLTNLYTVARAANSLEATAGTTTQHNQSYRALLSPNDPLQPQWFTARLGQPAAWDLTTGSVNTTIAIIDTGFALAHQDLTGRWDTNPGEAGPLSSNGVDDDANGLVDDWRGWDFVNGDNNPNAGSNNPSGESVSHGTAVAGMLGATGNNNLGLAGVDWQAKLLPLQILSDNGMGYTTDIVAALAYARAQGADVVNMSLGTSMSDDFLQEAIEQTIAAGVTVVAAAGNDGCDCVSYPAHYADVIAVGASDTEDNRAYFSNYGASLDILAPGDGAIRTTYWSQANQTSLYTTHASGTSLAAPLVSGMASLFIAAHPEAPPAEVVANITRGASRVAAMGQQSLTAQHGHGLMNVQATTRLATITHPDGTLVINKNTNTIYLVEDGTKRKISNPQIFLSHYPNTNYLVKQATLADVALPDGPALNFQSGTLVKASAAGMYVLAYDGATLQRRLIPSIQDFLKLGYQNAPLLAISDAQMNAIPRGQNLTAAGRHPDGTLVRQEGSAGVFLLEAGKRRSIPSVQVLLSLNKGKVAVLPATTADMALPRAAESQNVNFPEGSVVHGSTAAHYVVDRTGDGPTKRHIASTFIFNLLEFAPQEVITVSDVQLPAANGSAVQ